MKPATWNFQHKDWGGARVVEWGRLLSGYRGEILGRRFESCPPRHYESAFHEERVFRSQAFHEAHSWSALRRWQENVSYGDTEFQKFFWVSVSLLSPLEDCASKSKSYFKLNFIPKCEPLNPSLS